MELSNTIKKPRGPSAGVLNEMILLPVMKSKMGMADVSLVLSCLNIKPPSDSLMQKKMNLMSDKATAVNEEEMCNKRAKMALVCSPFFTRPCSLLTGSLNSVI
ncbi:hypothetical protein DPMN_024770 [Dreissena polymorpha]|uniref:Mutator-like transposase domain-containing protein n=1 Tax=Dreissena polymorpha TaxID=45954 RepID=A0A9D4LQ59_DREPO|nr:hypothetical protein DPMN_024770 [Dreissena polymorpha]